MTRPSQKQRERRQAEAFAARTNREWMIELAEDESRYPDLIVMENEHRFGIEVRQLYFGSVTRQTSSGKRRPFTSKQLEEGNTKRLRQLAGKCLDAVGVPVHVQVLSRLYRYETKELQFDRVDDDILIAAIARLHMDPSPLWTRYEIELENYVKLFVKRSRRNYWELINDGVGWVSKDTNVIRSAIDTKSKNLARYRASGIDDIRLLLVADRKMNSGKIEIDAQETFDGGGFTEIYLDAFPQVVRLNLLRREVVK